MKLKDEQVRSWWLVPLLAFFVLLIVVAMNWRENRILKRIIIKGNKSLSTEKILELADVKVGEKLYRLDLDKIRRKIEKHRFVKRAFVYRNLPDVLIIEIVERKPMAMFSQNGEIFYVDEEGFVFSFNDVSRVFPVVMISGANFLKNDSLLKGMLNVVKIAREEEVENLISEISFKDGGIVLFSKKGGFPIFVDKDELRKKFAYLRAFWEQVMTQSGLRPLYIDLRFNGQVVVGYNHRKNKEDLR